MSQIPTVILSSRLTPTSILRHRAHVIGTYLVTLIVFYFIWRNYAASHQLGFPGQCQS